jgi:hypothetical protein
MKTRHKILIAFACCHIALVALGTAGISLLPGPNIPGETLRLYSHVSGADNNYGFFAPGVGPEQRVTFTMTDKNGRQWQDDLSIGKTHEANLRLGSVSNLLVEVEDDTAELMIQSMAAKMFDLHPQAVSVKVHVDTFAITKNVADESRPAEDFPSMKEYRLGRKPRWIPLYSMTYTRNEKVASL